MWAIIGVAVAGAVGGGAIYALNRDDPVPVAARIDEPSCDSCSARKKDLSRLREALNAPAAGTD